MSSSRVQRERAVNVQPLLAFVTYLKSQAEKRNIPNMETFYLDS